MNLHKQWRSWEPWLRFEVGLMCGMSGYHVVVWYVVVGLTVVVGDGKYGITLKEERNPRGFIHKAKVPEMRRPTRPQRSRSQLVSLKRLLVRDPLHSQAQSAHSS